MSFDPFLTLGTVRFKRFLKKVRSQSPNVQECLHVMSEPGARAIKHIHYSMRTLRRRRENKASNGSNGRRVTRSEGRPRLR